MTAAAIPIVDIRPLCGGGQGDLETIAAEIGRACRDAGFFHAAHPPVPAALREAVFAAAHAFFALPPERKAAVAIARSEHNRGYVGLAVETLGPARGADRKEAFNVGLELDDHEPEVLAGKPFRGPDLMRWTNDIHVSTPHRVAAPADRARYSVAFFLDADPDAVVETLPGCIAEDRSSRYDPMTVVDHLRARLDATCRS